jgi:hypothetical protein
MNTFSTITFPNQLGCFSLLKSLNKRILKSTHFIISLLRIILVDLELNIFTGVL